MVLSFENGPFRTIHTRCFPPTVEIKVYNVMIDGKNFLYQPVKINSRTYENIRKIATLQGDGYTTVCLLDCPYFEKYYKTIAID